jgi:uncharacterized protein (TIGR00730 family)
MGKKPEYLETARKLGLFLAENEIELVYGGANVGLMKILADTMLDNGGEVIGVMPRMLVEKEVAHHDLQRLHIVETMSDRKTMIMELSEAFIAMPGGFGTLDELAEVITSNQLRLTDKPIGILNVAGYFDPLMDFFDNAVTEGFLRVEHRENLIADDSVESLLAQMTAYQPVSMDKWIKDIHRESNSRPERK